MHLYALLVREDNIHIVSLAIVFGSYGDENLQIRCVANVKRQFGKDIVVLVPKGIHAQVHLHLALAQAGILGVGWSFCTLMQVGIYLFAIDGLCRRNLNNPVVEHPVALHILILAVGVHVRAMGIEVEADVIRAVNLQDNVLVVVLVVQLVEVGKLLVTPVGTHILHQHRAIILLMGNIVGICRRVVAIVKVPDELVLPLVFRGLFLVGPPADNFRLQVVEYGQHVHIVGTQADVAVEAIFIRSLTFINLLNPDVLPGYRNRVLCPLAHLAEFLGNLGTLLVGNVNRSLPRLIPDVTAGIVGTCFHCRPDKGGGRIVDKVG